MSTRSCIARLTSKAGKPIKFKGTYHHWDGYPSGLGATLFQLRNGHFNGDTEAMLKYLIDEHPAGWSTIQDADFNLPAAPRQNSTMEICQHCGLPNWRHYAQYYVETNQEWIEAGRPECPPKVSGYRVLDHDPKPEDKPHGPECFVDGKDFIVTQKNASNCGCEYVYAFTPDGKTMVVLSSYTEKGTKMIGMFGSGDPKAEWKVIGEINLDGLEPTEEQWQKIPIEQVKEEVPA